VTSMLCGAAVSLSQIVIFRLLQGIFGAPLVPLSQSVLLDAYPPEQQGQAMAVFGLVRSSARPSAAGSRIHTAGAGCSPSTCPSA
jgi:MFS family permease